MCRNLSGAKLAENQRPRDKGNFKWFEDALVSLKMYDAKANFAKKLTKEVKDELVEYGWNPEAHSLLNFRRMTSRHDKFISGNCGGR